MKFQVITIGKKHDKNLEDFIQDFEKRIKANFDFEWSILKSEDDNNKEVQIKKESEKILEFLQKNHKNSFVILLDETGKEKTTKEISNLFEEKMNEGIEKIIFIIGGAFGVSEDIFKKGDLILGLSKLTLPHQLVRALLTEQIYRAISILKNGKYHHE